MNSVQDPERMPDIVVRGALSGDIIFEGSCTTATALWEKLKDVGEDIDAVQLLHGLREVLDTDFLLTPSLEFHLVRNASIAVLPRFLQRWSTGYVEREVPYKALSDVQLIGRALCSLPALDPRRKLLLQTALSDSKKIRGWVDRAWVEWIFLSLLDPQNAHCRLPSRGGVWRLVDESLRTDVELGRLAVKLDPSVFAHFEGSLRSLEMATHALFKAFGKNKNRISVSERIEPVNNRVPRERYSMLPVALQLDDLIAHAAVRWNPACFLEVPSTMQTTELAAVALAYPSFVAAYIFKALNPDHHDRRLLLLALRAAFGTNSPEETAMLLKMVPPALRQDREVLESISSLLCCGGFSEHEMIDEEDYYAIVLRTLERETC